MNIAMWSGPRNLSTALMYSFGNRADTSAVDEPFYAAYLAATGLDHPMRQDVISAQPTDPDMVEKALLEPVSTPHFYQKHMTQHLLDEFPRRWMDQVEHVFLIRHPARVLASWANKHDSLTLSDIGFAQQVAIFEDLCAQGKRPLVIDSADIRQAPEGMLRKLCDALGLDWDANMLTWDAGSKPYDGIWASHWYDAVHRSTGFAGAEGTLPELNPTLAQLNEKALPLYDKLAALKLTV